MPPVIVHINRNNIVKDRLPSCTYSENYATCEFIGNYCDEPKTFSVRPNVDLNSSKTNVQQRDSILPPDDLISYFNSTLDENSFNPNLITNDPLATPISTQKNHFTLIHLINYSTPLRPPPFLHPPISSLYLHYYSFPFILFLLPSPIYQLLKNPPPVYLCHPS